MGGTYNQSQIDAYQQNFSVLAYCVVVCNKLCVICGLGQLLWLYGVSFMCQSVTAHSPGSGPAAPAQEPTGGNKMLGRF